MQNFNENFPLSVAGCYPSHFHAQENQVKIYFATMLGQVSMVYKQRLAGSDCCSTDGKSAFSCPSGSDESHRNCLHHSWAMCLIQKSREHNT